MSLSDLESAVLEYVGDVLVNECGRPAPDRLLRYHGVAPDDCCTTNGTLSISWEVGYPSEKFPSRGNSQCVGAPVYTLNVRYVTCWPGLGTVTPEGYVLPDDAWDSTAAMLADAADCVSRSLMRLACDPISDDPLVAAILEQCLRNQFQWIETTPVRPSGLCAGVTWKMYASVKSAAVPS